MRKQHLAERQLKALDATRAKKRVTVRVTATKRKRRALLAAVLLGWSPIGMATGLSAGDPLSRPPLPIGESHRVTLGGAAVRENPFCQPMLVKPAAPVQLASGAHLPSPTMQSTTRLRATGEAIGFRKIGSNAITHLAPPTINIQPDPAGQTAGKSTLTGPTLTGPALTESTLARQLGTGLVHLNPMVQIPSVGTSGADVLDADVVAADPNDLAAWISAGPAGEVANNDGLGSAQKRLEGPRGSSVILVPDVRFPQVAPSPDNSVQAPESVQAPGQASEPSPTDSSSTTDVQTTGRDLVASQPIDEDTQPVFFSFTDSPSSSSPPEDAIAVAMDSPQSEHDEQDERIDRPSDSTETLAMQITDVSKIEPSPPAGLAFEDREVFTPQDSNLGTTGVVDLDSLGFVDAADDHPVILPGDDQHDDMLEQLEAFAKEVHSEASQLATAVSTPKPIAGGVVSKREPTLHTRRYRPPVAVGALPVEFQTLGTDLVGQSEPSVVTAAPSLVSPPDESPDTAVALHMNLDQERSLILGGELQRFDVADESVCRAVATGPNQIKLIGKGNGKTRMVVYAAPVKGQTEPRVQSFDVHVQRPRESTTKLDPVDAKLKDLNQTIRQSIPDADVVVRRSGGGLAVTGRCGSNATAKKIVRDVRRTFLLPVSDQLSVW